MVQPPPDTKVHFALENDGWNCPVVSGGDDGGPGWSGLRSVAAGRTRPVGLGQDSGGIGLGDRLDRTSDDHLLESPITPTAVPVPGASGLYG